MARIFPNSTSRREKQCSKSSNAAVDATCDMPEGDGDEAVVLTVWKKSLLLNCKGFTVFDATGNLVYRVDNYVAGNSGEIVLMDAAGKPLLTIRRKRLSFGDSWIVYDGEQTSDPRFSVRRQVNFRNTKTLAHVSSGTTSSPAASPPSSPRKNVVYEIEGSYPKRSVSVYDNSRRCVAKIRQKEAAGGVALGFDVFSLIVVRPYMDPSVAMALVILLDQMFGSSSSSTSVKRLSS
ncbi:hypothetical protein V2J09_011171 [Rumex salicifolius]